MDVRGTHVFDAPIDRVWAMFHDPDSHVAKFEQMGHRNIEVVDHHGDDDRLVLTIRREVTVEVPGFARKVLRPTNTVTSVDDWRRHDDGTCSGVYTVDAPGVPIDVRGSTRLTPDGDRTTYEVEVTVSVNIPLIGGKISSWARGDVEQQLLDEFAAGDRWLAEHP